MRTPSIQRLAFNQGHVRCEVPHRSRLDIVFTIQYYGISPWSMLLALQLCTHHTLVSRAGIQRGVVIGPTPNVRSVPSRSRTSLAYPYECSINRSDHNRRQVLCNYPNRRKERGGRGFQEATEVSLPMTSSIASHAMVGVSDLLAARFLDPDIFHLMQLEIPKVDAKITKAVIDLVGSISDIQAVANIHFDGVHTWMPIISKKQFYDNLLHRLSYRRSELFLLTLSMKLCSATHIVTPKTILYRMVKQLHFDIESSGTLSIQVLQAAVLIALYELGHAIYPAALLSVGCCARYATALDINKPTASLGSIKLPWIEEEETRRVWWAIAILDRCVLCSPSIKWLINIFLYSGICFGSMHLLRSTWQIPQSM